jgi:hypothetical protein
MDYRRSLILAPNFVAPGEAPHQQSLPIRTEGLPGPLHYLPHQLLRKSTLTQLKLTSTIRNGSRAVWRKVDRRKEEYYSDERAVRLTDTLQRDQSVEHAPP